MDVMDAVVFVINFGLNLITATVLRIFSFFSVIAPPIGGNCSNLVCNLRLSWCACVPNFVKFVYNHFLKLAFVHMNLASSKRLVCGVETKLYGLQQTQMCAICI